jgi:uncharacterized membrane protein YgdD (TMEM256/DUF423 family)
MQFLTARCYFLLMLHALALLELSTRENGRKSTTAPFEMTAALLVAGTVFFRVVFTG